MIGRRTFLYASATLLASSAPVILSAATAPEIGTESITSGRLSASAAQAWFEGEGGKRWQISGDEPTGRILHDPRLYGKVVEAKGRWTAPGRFQIAPIETRPMVIVENAKRWRVTYYCDVCSIRTYSPGPCMCCQAETRLDLIDPARND